MQLIAFPYLLFIHLLISLNQLKYALDIKYICVILTEFKDSGIGGDKL